MNPRIRKAVPWIVLLVAAGAGYAAWRYLDRDQMPAGFAKGNGRIEGTEVDVATKFAGRLDEVLAAEGDFVHAGQVLARMQVQDLVAQREEAVARYQQALQNVAGAEAQVALQQSDEQAAEALVVQRRSELDAAQRRLARSETLALEGASSGQELDDDRARVRSGQAVVRAAEAQVRAASAGITAARASVTAARALVTAAAATVARVDADLAERDLKAPRDARVQFRVAEPGEVLPPGGKVLNLIDVGDVYMTFFLPETIAGRVALGSEARIVLDAAPGFVIPARVSFVASTAQFTPKTVETATERQKLMFRVKARIDPALLRKYLEQVKTGLPGVAWVRIESAAEWPERLQTKVAP